MIQKIKTILGLLIVCFLLSAVPSINGTRHINKDILTNDSTLEKNDDNFITIEYGSYFLEKETEHEFYSLPLNNVQRIENLIKKIRQLNTPQEFFPKSTYEKINNEIVENLLYELETLENFPKINARWRLLQLFHHLSKTMLSPQCSKPKLMRKGADDFLINMNCKIILFGRLTDVTLEPDNLMGFNTPWYLRYHEHLKPGWLITYDGLLKNDMIHGDFLITGRWFRGFYINIGFPDNYLDLTLGWTAFVMAHR